MTAELPKSFEIIDNENPQIIEKLWTEEEKMALSTIKVIDKIVLWHDLDLAIDREKNRYYFVWDKKIALNIPLSFDKLIDLWTTLTTLFKSDKIQLAWDKYWRSIYTDKSLVPLAMEDELIKNWMSNLSKNDIEELFVFVNRIKWVNINNWEIDNTICANWKINQECINALWNLDK